MFQRLQERMNKQKVIQESEPELLSFYPEPEDGMALVQVTMICFSIKNGRFINDRYLTFVSIFVFPPCSGVCYDHTFPASGGIWQAFT